MDLETFKKKAIKKEFLDPDTTLKIMERLLQMPLDMMYSNAEIEPGSDYSMIPAVLDLLEIDDSEASEISLSDLIKIAFYIKDDPKDSERYSWLARYLLLWHQNYVPFLIEESPNVKKEKFSANSDHDMHTEISKKAPVKNESEDPDTILKIMELLLQMPLDKMYSDAELRPGYSCYKLPAIMDKLRYQNSSTSKWTLKDIINVIYTDEDERLYLGINISDYDCSMLELCLLLWYQNFVPFWRGEKNI